MRFNVKVIIKEKDSINIKIGSKEPIFLSTKRQIFYIPQGQVVVPNFLKNSELSTKFSSKYFLE